VTNIQKKLEHFFHLKLDELKANNIWLGAVERLERRKEEILRKAGQYRYKDQSLLPFLFVIGPQVRSFHDQLQMVPGSSDSINPLHIADQVPRDEVATVRVIYGISEIKEAAGQRPKTALETIRNANWRPKQKRYCGPNKNYIEITTWDLLAIGRELNLLANERIVATSSIVSGLHASERAHPCLMRKSGGGLHAFSIGEYADDENLHYFAFRERSNIFL